MSRHKWFIFHPEDWLADSRLSLCSYATKGAWMDLMCYMHQSQRGGYLTIEGKALTKDDVEKMLKCRSTEEFDGIWNELLMNGVMRQHEDGTYYSKRMVEDIEKVSLSGTATTEERELANKVLDEFHRVVRPTKGYDKEGAVALIISHVRKGVRFEDFQAVMRNKFEQWSDSDKMRQHLRPATLFGDRFIGYLEETKDVAPVAMLDKPIAGRFDYDDL